MARVGTTLRAGWHLDRLLGVGGMAAVYAATHASGKRGALKLLHGQIDPEMRLRFLREGRIANSVGHPGVVRVIDDEGNEDGSAFLVMELLEGETLAERATRSGIDRLSVDIVLTLTDQMLGALTAAHDKDIIHRDIKPGNVFLTTDGRVKILDFGIAHLSDPAQSLVSMTVSGRAMGTPAFMAPEQARARWDLVGPRSDLWSVGATMFTLLSGELVHEGDTFQEMLASAISTPARSLAFALPGAPLAVVDVVDRALERKLSNRWSSAREMQQAVRAAYRAISGTELVAPPIIRAWAPSPAHRPAPRPARPPVGLWRRAAMVAMVGLGLAPATT